MFEKLNLIAVDWNLGINVTITGVTIVFGMLVLLVLVLSIFGLVFSKEKKKEVKATEPKKEPSVKNEVKKVVSVVTENNDEIIAVIAAAVAAMYEGSDVKPVIRKIKKSNTNSRPAWTAAGIFENTRAF